MPRKVRDLIRDLEECGFQNRGGKGSPRNLIHRNGSMVTISGKLVDDAKYYQEKAVKTALETLKKNEK